MATRDSVTSEVQAIVGGATRERGVDDVSVYIDMALREVSLAQPRMIRKTIVGDGTDEYALGSDWELGFSSINRVRYVPNSDFDAPAQWLQPEQYEVEWSRDLVSSEAVGTGDGSTKEFDLDESDADPTGSTVTVNAVTQASSAYSIEGDEDASLLTFVTAPALGLAIVASYYVVPTQIRLLAAPSTSDVFVVEFSARHALTDHAATTTLDPTLSAALVHKTAERILRAAAAGAAGIVPQGTDTDMLSGIAGTAGDAFRRLADDEKEAFNALLGIGGGKNGAGVGISPPMLVTVPATQNAANNSYLTHPRRRALNLGWGTSGVGR